MRSKPRGEGDIRFLIPHLVRLNAALFLPLRRRQATTHALYTNCVACGRIACEREGAGPCFFCGAPVDLDVTPEQARAPEYENFSEFFCSPMIECAGVGGPYGPLLQWTWT